MMKALIESIECWCGGTRFKVFVEDAKMLFQCPLCGQVFDARRVSVEQGKDTL
jgi:predicted RNA-binding Zn-ribbon protein involved in translation (DUF1610 family)